MLPQDELKALLLERQCIYEYVRENFIRLSESADKADTIRYGTKCDGLGRLCPSELFFRRDKKLRKGRFLKEKPADDRYTVYEINSGEPMRMRKYNRFGCDMSIYFYKNNDIGYAVPLFRETMEDYGRYLYKYCVKNGRLMEFAEIENDLVIREKYNYSMENDGIIECEWCYYLDFTVNRKEDASSDFYDFLSAKLEGKNFNVPTNESAPKLSRYLYRIFNNGKIEEYKLINEEKQFIRVI